MKKINLFLGFVFLCLVLAGGTQKVQGAQLTLAWDRNPETNITTYTLHRGTAPGVYDISTETGNTDHCTVDGLQEGVTYYFAVTASNPYGTSGYSNELSYPVPQAAVIVEDGLDPSNWTKVSGTPSQALVSVFDGESISDVLQFSGQTATTTVAYKVPLSITDASMNMLTWKFKMLPATDCYFVVDIWTAGSGQLRRIFYRLIDSSTLGTGTNIYYGIGSAAKTDGQWHTIVRDVHADLKAAQPTNNLLRIDNFWIYVKGLGPTVFLDDLQASALSP